MEWINFRHLYSFWVVKKAGGFKVAAEQINVSQSTVSEQVALLEEYLQKSVFKRNTRGLKLTETGQQLFFIADAIFEKSKEINLLIRDENSQLFGELKVGIIGGVSRNLIFRLLKDTLDQGTMKKFEVFNGSFDELSEACINYEIDFFVSLMPPTGSHLSLLDSKVIQKSDFCLTGNPKVLNRIKKKRVNPIEIDLYTFKYPYFDSDFLKKLSKKLNINLNIKLESDDISLLRFFANSGAGVALIPEIGVWEDISEKRLGRIKLPFFKPISFFVNYPKVSSKKEILEEMLENIY